MSTSSANLLIYSYGDLFTVFEADRGDCAADMFADPQVIVIELVKTMKLDYI